MVAVNVPEVKEAKPKRTAKKKKDSGINAEMFADLISGASGVVASRPDMAHWMIDKKEAMQIADPLARVIEKSESLKKVAEHSDSIALAVACMSVFVPRAFITVAINKEKKMKKHNKVMNELKAVKENHDSEARKTETRSGQAEIRNRKDAGENAPAGTNVSEAISELVYGAI